MKIALIIIGILIVTLIIFVAYWGGFKKLKISVSVAGGETLIYEEITGDYRQTGVVMDKLYYSLLNEDKIETFRGFGIYYDNPQKVEKSKLRSEAGNILEPSDMDRLPLLKEKYSTKIFPEQEYITTEFPYKGKMSVMFSIMKVYPALTKYAKANGYKEDTSVMEIYDIPNKRILYRKSIVR